MVVPQVSAAEFEARHQRLLKDRPGRLTIDETGVQFQQVFTAKQEKKVASGKKAPKLESVRLEFGEIQQLWLSPEKIVILTYEDRRWFLGVDREFEFYLNAKDPPLGETVELLQRKMDQRFVAAVNGKRPASDWEIKAKLLGIRIGSQGILRFDRNFVSYETEAKGQSRFWRLEDIENVSTSNPFQLSIVTFERAPGRYANRKTFNFQLKGRLDPTKFDALWKRLNQQQGLSFIKALEGGAN
ncbi:MAG: hypothetical protein IT168_26280 [Bryobacterales bacterium]|nr:hypothetical protein [Bryobacterales bacterium]